MLPARFGPQFSESVHYCHFPTLFRRFPALFGRFQSSEFSVFPGWPLFFSWQRILLYSPPLPFGKMLQMPECNKKFQWDSIFWGNSHAPSFGWCCTIEIWNWICWHFVFAGIEIKTANALSFTHRRTIQKRKKDHYLVVSTPLKNISQWEGLSHMYPYVMENKTCSKPPTK